MGTLLRTLGAAFLALGLAVAAVAGWYAATDAAFTAAAAAHARHPDHPLFRTEYWVAAARHWGLVAAAAAGLLGGVVLAALLIGIGEVVRRLPPR
jgi:hypothetical protein